MLGILRYFLVAIYLTGSINHSCSSDSLADSLLGISRYMSKPYMWVRANLARIYSPYQPGKYGQYSTTFGEIMYRNVLAETLLTIAPMALALGEMAVFPRYLSYSLRGEDYHYIVGDGDTKQFDSSFSILSLNICFLPGELPLLFGGVSPSSERIEAVASVISEKDPDVVCLYEVHEIDSAYELFLKLKKDFAYFYIDIGPDYLEMNSGLFVASKFKIENPEFKPFQYREMQEQINKGYFEFTLVDEDSAFAKIYTTHLQPYRKRIDEQIRKKEIQEIIDDIVQDNVSCPVILCGDLNIPWNSNEYFDSGISTLFYDNYTDGIEVVDESNRTYSAFLGDHRWDKINSETGVGDEVSHYSEIVDYSLIYNDGSNANLRTTRLDSFNSDDPEMALSDHHGLFSIVSFSKGEKKTGH
ncbi:MAG: endonuclease/exonuclease/phosphatase family protein [Chlamydiota bacterium]|nr:endonuclease/exonuclease/phosphatase family protein [Chlamydiota bacterium]